MANARRPEVRAGVAAGASSRTSRGPWCGGFFRCAQREDPALAAELNGKWWVWLSSFSARTGAENGRRLRLARRLRLHRAGLGSFGLQVAAWARLRRSASARSNHEREQGPRFCLTRIRGGHPNNAADDNSARQVGAKRRRASARLRGGPRSPAAAPASQHGMNCATWHELCNTI